MGRNWQPKYAVRCVHCEWEGVRTRSTMHYVCPKCGEPYVRKTVKDSVRFEMTPALQRAMKKAAPGHYTVQLKSAVHDTRGNVTIVIDKPKRLG